MSPPRPIASPVARGVPRTVGLLMLVLASLLGLCGPAAAERSPAMPERWMPRQADDALRVLSWNVSREHFFAQPERTVALLRLADPDILLLDEMPRDAHPDAIRAVLQQMAPGPWHVVLGGTGGNFERASVSARWPLRRVARFDHLTYPRRAMRRWIRDAGEHAERLRGSLPLGVAAVGAIAEVRGRRLLLVSFDLQCCGDQAGAWEEERRRVEAQLLWEAIAASRREEGIDGVLVGGDVNNVQGDAVLELLRGAGQTDALAVVAATRADGSDWSWDGRETPFASKRIDHLLYHGPLAPLQASLLDSEDFTAARATELGVAVDWSRLQSRHRPIVADFALTTPAPPAQHAD